MNTWRCSCNPEVGDAIVEKILDLNCANPERNDALRAAQIALVRDVCDKCWPGPDGGLEQILWVHTYVELATDHVESLRPTSDDTYLQVESFQDVLHGAGGVALDQEAVTAVYRDLGAVLTGSQIKRTQWLSNIFTDPAVPPVVSLWLDEGRLHTDWPALEARIDDVSFYGGTSIFRGREGGAYLHLSYPHRYTTLSHHVGPAGVYLFLKDKRSAKDVPPCLFSHLRSFLQGLVTAQLLALKQHLSESQRRAIDAAQLFVRNEGTLRDIADAAGQLRSALDPLGVGSATFAAGRRVTYDLLFSSPESHHVGQWLRRDPETINATLRDLADRLDNLVQRAKDADGSARVVTEIASAIRSACDNNELEIGLRHAKALDHHSVLVGLIDRSVSADSAAKAVTPAHQRQDSYLRDAITSIWSLKSEGVSMSIVPVLPAGHVATLRLVYPSLGDVADLLESAIALLEKRWGTGGKQSSRILAGVLRGLQGTSTNPKHLSNWLKTVRESCDSERFGIPFKAVLDK